MKLLFRARTKVIPWSSFLSPAPIASPSKAPPARDQETAPYIPTGAQRPSKNLMLAKPSGANVVTPPSAKSEPAASPTQPVARASRLKTSASHMKILGNSHSTV